MNRGSCNYSNLGNYDTAPNAQLMGHPPATLGPNADRAPYRQYVVPSWNAPSYSTLQHNVNEGPSCSGYFTIDNAYPGGNNCGQSVFGMTQTKYCR